MLILTRRIKESIMIADDIRITVLGIDHGHVKLGITAPRDVVVDREEIADRKRAERQVEVHDRG